MNKKRILINELDTFKKINSNVLGIFLALFGTLLLAISAKVQVPFWPVPMTMQTFVIFYNWNDLQCKTFFYHRCSLFI